MNTDLDFLICSRYNKKYSGIEKNVILKAIYHFNELYEEE